MTEITATVVGEVRPEIPARPRFLALFYDTSEEAWFASTPLEEDTKQSLADFVLENNNANTVITVRIPGEKESAWLAKREELVGVVISMARQIQVTEFANPSYFKDREGVARCSSCGEPPLAGHNDDCYKRKRNIALGGALAALDAHDASKPEGGA